MHLGKKFLYEQFDLDYFSAYELGAEIMVNNLELKDAQEGIRGFVQKKKPVWGHNFKKDKWIFIRSNFFTLIDFSNYSNCDNRNSR